MRVDARQWGSGTISAASSDERYRIFSKSGFHNMELVEHNLIFTVQLSA